MVKLMHSGKLMHLVREKLKEIDLHWATERHLSNYLVIVIERLMRIEKLMRLGKPMQIG
jgi:hypothetical protein